MSVQVSSPLTFSTSPAHAHLASPCPSPLQRPIPASSILEFTVAYSVCPLALYLLGPQRYARCRAPLVGLARFLTMRGSLGVGIGLGPLPQRFWTGFVWRLVLETLGITQVGETRHSWWFAGRAEAWHGQDLAGAVLAFA